MKKILTFILSLALCCCFGFMLSACNNENKETGTPITGGEAGTPDISANGNVLVAYFSWSASGNTEKMAKYIAEKTGAAIYEIEPKTPYPADYTPTTEVAAQEKADNARPEIKNPIDLSRYDTIFVGYPIWWWTAPMIIGTFLESNNLTGKDVYPFSQSASMDAEQFETSMGFVKSCADGAIVHDGLFARASDTSAIDAYLGAIDLSPKADITEPAPDARG